MRAWMNTHAYRMTQYCPHFVLFISYPLQHMGTQLS